MNEPVRVQFGSAIPHHHLSLLVDRMTYNKDFVQIFRHGINKDNTGPIAKASFEETPQNFIEAAVYGMVDEMRGISANVMCGQEGLYGTNMSQILMDMDAIKELDIDETPDVYDDGDVDDEIREQFDLDVDDKKTACPRSTWPSTAPSAASRRTPSTTTTTTASTSEPETSSAKKEEDNVFQRNAYKYKWWEASGRALSPSLLHIYKPKEIKTYANSFHFIIFSVHKLISGVHGLKRTTQM